ncbi:ANKEF1 [Cordylochernes scorpioides]|uniref:ANKEF1 n=1 Tax=Cordylochernes scorpioides TaxID=51811 RepID=A0ABY6LAB6_9ARAC|nr:ANKEF1 [Cordylochernes scorpioides]
MCGTSLKTINNIIHKDLELDTRRKGKVHKLTPFHMKNRATNARKLYEEHLAGSRSEYTATLDEAWMYVTYCNGIRKICYIKRGNQVPDNWVHQCSETFPKGFMVVGVMTGRGVLPLIKVPSKVKVNSEFYIECVLKPVIEQLKDLYPGEMDKVFLHHDKASSHTSNKTQQFLQEMKDTLGLNFIRNSDIPGKSPDASPLDFYGFGEKISPKEAIEENSSKEFSMEYQGRADPPARGMHASLAAARDDVTAPLIAASCSASTANPAPLIWGDSELAEMDDNDAFTVVRTKKRRRDSPVLPAMAAQSNSAGASRRQRSSTGWIPPVQEIRTTTAHVMEARARQASCTEEQCLYLEYCPDYQSYQYLRAIERVVGGPKNIFQFSKINGHYLLGLASKSLAKHLVREGLEIEGTLIRTFPFRKSSTRITVGNLPFFVADAAIIDALSRYGRITSIAPKLLKAGEFTYTDGRREAFILLHDGITIDKLPTRFEIRIKGEAWPAFLSHGIKCSKCHGQGHRRANCPQLHGRSTTARRASPPPSTDLPPSTAPGLPRQSSAAPPAPAPPSPSNKASRAPSDSCAASLPSAAPWPSTPAPPASPMQAVTPAPPPMTPSPEDPMGPRSAASRPEQTPPARPDFTTPCGPLPAQGTLGPATLTSDVDMTTTEETSASSPAAVISTLPLPAPRPAEPMLPTTYREELTPPLMTPPPAPRLAGPIPPVPHGDTTTPAMTTPPPPLSMDRRWKMAGDLIHGLSREIDLEHTFQSQVDIDDIVRAVLYPGDREPFIKRLPTRDRYILGGFISTAIWRARDADPSMLESRSPALAMNPAKKKKKNAQKPIVDVAALDKEDEMVLSRHLQVLIGIGHPALKPLHEDVIGLRAAQVVLHGEKSAAHTVVISDDPHADSREMLKAVRAAHTLPQGVWASLRTKGKLVLHSSNPDTIPAVTTSLANKLDGMKVRQQKEILPRICLFKVDEKHPTPALKRRSWKPLLLANSLGTRWCAWRTVLHPGTGPAPPSSRWTSDLQSPGQSRKDRGGWSNPQLRGVHTRPSLLPLLWLRPQLCPMHQSS